MLIMWFFLGTSQSKTPVLLTMAMMTLIMKITMTIIIFMMLDMMWYISRNITIQDPQYSYGMGVIMGSEELPMTNITFDGVKKWLDHWQPGLHNLFHPNIQDGSTWSKFGARGEHGDVFLFPNLGALWFSENWIRYSLHVCLREVKNNFFSFNTLIYGISCDGSKNSNIRTCEHMILGQLRMGARQAKNAPLLLWKFSYYREQERSNSEYFDIFNT